VVPKTVPVIEISRLIFTSERVQRDATYKRFE